MARVKRGFKARRRRNKVLKRAEGFRDRGGSCYTLAREKSDRAMVFAYRDRRVRRRTMRTLWIQRINAAARLNGTTYSKLIAGLLRVGVALDRKAMADIAVSDSAGFSKIVQLAVQPIGA